MERKSCDICVCFIKNLFKIFSSTLVFSFFLGFFLVFAKYNQAQAGFFSSVFGGEAYAQTDKVTPPLPVSNSQNMGLLQANVSPASVLQDKSSKNDKSNSDTIDNSANVNIVSDSAMLPATGPMGVSDGTNNTDSSPSDTSVYVVRKGDSLSAIADMFGVSVNTILSANNMKKGDKLVEGDVLLILPISGVEHTVTKGQTLQNIAKLYKVDAGDIASYNGIALDDKLTVGDTLMIPGADNMLDEGGDKPAPNLGSAISRDLKYYASHPLQDLIGYFINPLPTGHKTQGLHGPGHRGIDIGAPLGTPIYAAASGVVLTARMGWDGGYGNMIVIENDSTRNIKTLYGHLSRLAISTGDQVNQGQIIGYVGSTGHSTGPHLHFEVFNAKNPGADWSWANNQVASRIAGN